MANSSGTLHFDQSRQLMSMAGFFGVFNCIALHSSSSSSSSWSRSRRGPSRSCTTMSAVDSTPPWRYTNTFIVIIIIIISLYSLLVFIVDCLQCFDAVGWAAGRASGM